MRWPWPQSDMIPGHVLTSLGFGRVAWRSPVDKQLVSGSPGITDHGLLTGLADDDHLQYFLLAGRAGGQAGYGSNSTSAVSTDHLILHPNASLDTQHSRVDLYRNTIGLYGDLSLYDETSATPTITIAQGANATVAIAGVINFNNIGLGGNEILIQRSAVGGSVAAYMLRMESPTSFAGSGGTIGLLEIAMAAASTGDMARFYKPGGSLGSRIDVNGAWVGPMSGALTPTSLVVADNAFTIQDNGDPTKQVQFELSGLTTGTTRTLTVPDTSMVLAGRNVANAFSANQEVDSASALILNLAGTAAYPNSTGLLLKNGGFTTEINCDLTADHQIIIPDADGELVTADSTVTLNNKTLNGGAGGNNNIDCAATNGVLFRKGTSGTSGFRLVLTSLTAARNWNAIGDLGGNIPLVGDDPPSVASGRLGKVDLTAQSAAITSTNLSNTPGAGFYVIDYEITCTTGDGTAGAIQLDVTITGDGGSQTTSSASLPLTTATLSSTNPIRGTMQRYLASGDIAYAVPVTGAVNAARFAVRIRVTALG